MYFVHTYVRHMYYRGDTYVIRPHTTFVLKSPNEKSKNSLGHDLTIQIHK